MKFWQVIVLILLVAALAVGIAVWQPWRATGRTINVSAEVMVKGVPDVSKITAGVEITRDTADLAQKDASATLDKIIQAAKAKGVAEKDIQTNSVTTQPDRKSTRLNSIT